MGVQLRQVRQAATSTRAPVDPAGGQIISRAAALLLFRRLPEPHRQMLPNLPAKIAAARHCAYQNHLLLKQLLAAAAPGAAPDPLAAAAAAGDEHAAAHGDAVSPHDADKVRYVLKNLVRDWSAEGAAERAQSYGPILSELRRVLAGRLEGGAADAADAAGDADPEEEEEPPPRVLVPGCGLGRLCAEVAGLGCEALGNEFSYYMLLASHFALNSPERAEQVSAAARPRAARPKKRPKKRPSQSVEIFKRRAARPALS
jgi:carnosine N-methyltransferase